MVDQVLRELGWRAIESQADMTFLSEIRRRFADVRDSPEDVAYVA